MPDMVCDTTKAHWHYPYKFIMSASLKALYVQIHLQKILTGINSTNSLRRQTSQAMSVRFCHTGINYQKTFAIPASLTSTQNAKNCITQRRFPNISRAKISLRRQTSQAVISTNSLRRRATHRQYQSNSATQESHTGVNYPNKLATPASLTGIHQCKELIYK